MFTMFYGSQAKGLTELDYQSIILVPSKELAAINAGSTGTVYTIDVELGEGQIVDFNKKAIVDYYIKMRDKVLDRFPNMELPDITDPHFIDHSEGLPSTDFPDLQVLFEDEGFRAIWLSSSGNRSKVLEVWNPGQNTKIIHEEPLNPGLINSQDMIGSNGYYTSPADLEDFEFMKTPVDIRIVDKIENQRGQEHIDNLLKDKKPMVYAQRRLAHNIIRMASLAHTKEISNLLDAALDEVLK